MSVQVISLKDRHLLADIKRKLAVNKPPLCPDFYQLLQTIGYLSHAPIVVCFENLLLDDTDHIIFSIQHGHLPGIGQIVTLFDQYLACLSRRLPTLTQDANETRIALEAMRRLVFSILRDVLLAEWMHASRNVNMGGRGNAHIDSNILQQDQFVTVCNQLLQFETSKYFAILAIQFDFGLLSAEAVQQLGVEMATRLCEIKRDHDLIARISVRHWALCLKNVDHSTLTILAATKIKHKFEQPFSINQQDRIISPHIGIALSSGHAGDAASLLQAAHSASVMPVTHAEGYQIYDAELAAEAQRMDELSVLLKKALFENTLELYYQPKYSLSQNKIVSLEALLRWPQGEGFVPIPVIFSLIEREGLLDNFTVWLVQTALRQLSDFIQKGMDIKLSINILPENLLDKNFSEFLASVLNIWQVPKGRLVIEITEGSLVEGVEETLLALRKISGMGIKIAMDDFGTGYSSLSYLSRLPIDELKIDQAFIRNMLSSPREAALVRTVIELGNNFDLDLVAEGVESEEVAIRLAQMGCDVIQGYWISEPIPAQQLFDWFERDEKNIWQKMPSS
jgi:EAL domain-containing protein (putative c-di-GMP-specific phosphodiesterase class I)